MPCSRRAVEAATHPLFLVAMAADAPRDTTDLILRELGFTPWEGALIRAAHLADGMPLELHPPSPAPATGRKRKREGEEDVRNVVRRGEGVGGKVFRGWAARAEAWLARPAGCVLVVQAPTPYAFYTLLEYTQGERWGGGEEGARGGGLGAPFPLPPAPVLTLQRDGAGRMEALGLFLGVVTSHPVAPPPAALPELSFYVATALDDEMDGWWVGFVDPPTRAGGTLVMLGRRPGGGGGEAQGPLQDAVTWVLQRLQQTPSPRGIVPRAEMQAAQEELARLLARRKRWATAPVNLTRDAMEAGGGGTWLASVKVDGTRCAVLVTSRGVYAVVPFPKRAEDLRRRTTVIKLGGGASASSPPLPTPTLMDGELLADGRLVLFDVLVEGGRNCTHQSFEERRPLVRRLVGAEDGVRRRLYLHDGACVKPVFKAECLQLAATLALRDMDAPPYPVDGLILQPVPAGRPGRGYHHEQIYKWKPPEAMTIDVLARRGPGGARRAHVVPPGTVHPARAPGAASDVATRLFQGSDRFPCPEGVPVDLSGLPHHDPASLGEDHRVFECCYDAASRSFRAVRVRRDRCGVPNSWYVASLVWDDIQEPLRRSELELSLELHEEEEEEEEEEGA